MRVDRLTNQLQTALSDAQSLAIGKDQQFIEPIHLLSAMVEQRGGSVRPLLSQAGASITRLREAINDALNALSSVQGGSGDILMSNDLARLMNIADKLSQQKKDSYISCETVLLALFETKNTIATLLEDVGVDKKSLHDAIEQVRGGESIDDPDAEESRQALAKYTIDLTERAEQGKLDPVIGRDEEIRRTIQVLQRRTKNNPVLIGEPGVGKSSLLASITAIGTSG